MMQEFFNDKEPNTSINPDEAVEDSAAMQGASHRERSSQCKTCCYRRDSFAHVGDCWWRSDQLIERNTTIPPEGASLGDRCDIQPGTLIQLFDGEGR